MAGYDAVVVGAGPNGFAAAIALAASGRSVLLREATAAVGGGVRSEALTLPGFVHDVGSAVHPLGAASPFFRTLPLAEHGLRWIQPPAPLAHPFDDRPPAILERSMDATGRTLGRDAGAWQSAMSGLVADWEPLLDEILAPLHWPRRPMMMARFGLAALRSARGYASGHFRGDAARALFAAIAGHALVPLDDSPSAAFALVLAVAAHAVGWPIPAGGSGALTAALASHFRARGGEIVTDAPLRTMRELDGTPLVMLDLTPRQLLAIAGDRLPRRYLRSLRRYRYGPGAFKLDWALSAPIPWRDAECARAGTLHLAGGFDDVLMSEAAPWHGQHAAFPLVILAQPSLFDASRAPPGKHTAWAYCHVPNGSAVDMATRIEAQVERFAPGFRDCVLARHVSTPAALERMDANLVGGDIGGGASTLSQVFFRPAMRRDPYATPLRGVYLCSSSTPPGGGVHGMCGLWAVRSALARADA